MAYLPEDFDQVIRAMGDGLYDLTGWVETTSLEGVQQAFHRLRAGVGLKILVDVRQP